MKIVVLAAVFIATIAGVSFGSGTGSASGEYLSYFNEGLKAQQRGDLNTAETSYRKTLLLQPQDNDCRKYIFNNMGIIYANRGDVDRAEEAFNTALTIDPDYLVAQKNLGLIYDARMTKQEALEYWAKVFKLDEMRPKVFIVDGQKATTK